MQNQYEVAAQILGPCGRLLDIGADELVHTITQNGTTGFAVTHLSLEAEKMTRRWCLGAIAY